MMTETQFIRNRCLGLIRESSMNESHWEMTILDDVHPQIQRSEPLMAEEYPMVSFFAGEGERTIYTTHRMVGKIEGSRTEIPRMDYDSSFFGDFKQDLDSPRVTIAIITHARKKSRFLYESGYASMAPIHYFKFWSHKWPVWRRIYEIGVKGQR